MSTAFAKLEQRLGAATRRVFRNATAVLPSGRTVDGTFTRAPAQALAGIGAASRDVTFACGIADLESETLGNGAALVINGPHAQAQAWRVRSRIDEYETGDVLLTLEELTA